MNVPARLNAPFSPETVEALNRWQACDWVHQFTCGSFDGDMAHARHRAAGGREPVSLVAAESGWFCPVCGYRQTWAHEFMLTTPPAPWGIK